MPLEARRSLHLFSRLTLAMFLLLVTGPTPLLLGFCRGFISDFISLTKSLVPPTPELCYYQWLVDSKIRRFRSTWFKNAKYSIVFSSFFHIKVKYLWKKILITILSICICPSIFVSMIAYNWQNETNRYLWNRVHVINRYLLSMSSYKVTETKNNISISHWHDWYYGIWNQHK